MNIENLNKKQLFSALFIIFSFSILFSQRKVEKVNYEKYEHLMGPYYKETRAEFNERMKWFDEVNMGMFIHFGLYSHLGGMWKDSIEIPGNNAEWIWSRISKNDPNYHYQQYFDLVNDWNPKDFDAEEVVLLAKELGMQYITITTKHHEGFCLWPSKYTDFDIESTPMKGRDVIGELSTACKKHGLRFGAYYSITDWHQGIKEAESLGKAKPTSSGGWEVMPSDHEKYFQYMKNQLKELVDNYDVDLFWFDADWAQKFLTHERAFQLYEYCRSIKPSILVNERSFSRRHPDIPKKDFGSLEHTVPSAELIAEQQDPEKKHYYEYCTSTQISWGHDKRPVQATNAYANLPEKMLKPYALMRRMNGNYLLNFGPDENGKFNPEAVMAAKDFAVAARKLDKMNDYSTEAIQKVVGEMKFDKEKYANPNHLLISNPELHKRIGDAMKYPRLVDRTLSKLEDNPQSEKLRTQVKEQIQTMKDFLAIPVKKSDPNILKRRIPSYNAKLEEFKSRMAQLGVY